MPTPRRMTGGRPPRSRARSPSASGNTSEQRAPPSQTIASACGWRSSPICHASGSGSIRTRASTCSASSRPTALCWDAPTTGRKAACHNSRPAPNAPRSSSSRPSLPEPRERVESVEAPRQGRSGSSPAPPAAAGGGAAPDRTRPSGTNGHDELRRQRGRDARGGGRPSLRRRRRERCFRRSDAVCSTRCGPPSDRQDEITPGRNVMLDEDDVPNVEIGVWVDEPFAAPPSSRQLSPQAARPRQLGHGSYDELGARPGRAPRDHRVV